MSAALGTFENPRPYDILCGRNRNTFNNIGNRRFRITINMNVEKYDALHSRHERSKFIASLAHTMRYEVGFRFLKKNGKNSETVDLTDDEVRAKIGHALRDLSTVLRETGGDDGSNADSKVPRPGPYKKQDKQFKTENNREPEAARATPSPAPMFSSSSSQDKTPQSAAIPEEDSQKMPAPDQVRSSTPQVVLSSMPRSEEQITPFKSYQHKNVSKMFDQEHEHLKIFPLEVGQACQSLLNHPSQSILHSLDDDLDEFWTHEQLQNERSGRSQRTAMSIGTFDLHSNNERSGRSQRSATSIGTLDLLSNNERSGRSQRSAMSVSTFDASLNSSCLSDALETMSFVGA